jgi:hypothetical protein
MNVVEETIDAMLDSNGQLQLTHQPRLPPGPVRVTIRAAAAVAPQRGLADVIREIAAEQRSRGFPGRSSDDLSSEDDPRLAEDADRDRELDAARRGSSSGGPAQGDPVRPGTGRTSTTPPLPRNVPSQVLPTKKRATAPAAAISANARKPLP